MKKISSQLQKNFFTTIKKITTRKKNLATMNKKNLPHNYIKQKKIRNYKKKVS